MTTNTINAQLATLSAYDYETQGWVTGEPARILRLSQLRQELTLLTAPNGAEYLKFNGARVDLATAITNTKAQIAELEALAPATRTAGKWELAGLTIMTAPEFDNGNAKNRTTICGLAWSGDDSDEVGPYNHGHARERRPGLAEARANGDLLVAAPDMLAALESIRRLAAPLMTSEAQRVFQNHPAAEAYRVQLAQVLLAAIGQARDAVAKVGGAK